ncbi:MAG: 2-amino-4-hydroxy-6-hydroxymethyldihydropteridine diphosphokinase [Lentisphaeria bacterium]|jgi:2-amino-4-hydroxy-6-hydroxymethyldihydropteridine diphosphokinase
MTPCDTLTPENVYIGMGSNLDNPLNRIVRAYQTIAAHEQLSLKACSHWYTSEALGPSGQPDYVNGAVLVQTKLNPELVLDLLQAIEAEHGRQRSVRWGARTLDLDILLYGSKHVLTERLTIPHCQLRVRNFVLQPLMDIDKHLLLPDGTAIATLLTKVGTHGLQKLDMLDK